VALKLRGEREIQRVQALLDLPQFATNGMYVSIFVLLIAGVAAAFIAGLGGRALIWAAIVLLVLMFVAMYAPRPGSAICDVQPVRRTKRGRERSRRSRLTPRASRRSPRRAGQWRSRRSDTADSS
jgi:membrane protein implicated in regulation of membrane protease activity